MENRRCSYKTTAELPIVRNEQRIAMQPIVARRHDRAQARHYIVKAAHLAIENGNLQNAARYLNRIKSSSRYYDNTLGVLEMLEGQYPKAQQSLSKAQRMGLEQAAQNLEQITTKLKNIERLKNQ